MRIGFFGDFNTRQEYYGGADRSTAEWAARLRDHCQVQVVSIHPSREPFRETLACVGVDYASVMDEAGVSRPLGEGGALRQLGRVLGALPTLKRHGKRATSIFRDAGTELIVCNNFRYSATLALGEVTKDIPVVVFLRGWYIAEELPWYGLRLFRHCMAGVLALSYHTKSALCGAGFPVERVHVLQNPIDATAWQERGKAAPDSALPGMERPVRVVVPGTLRRLKGQHLAVRAMRRVVDAGHDAILWLAGERYSNDDPYWPKLERTIGELGLADRVVKLGSRKDMPQVMAAATHVVVPSTTEGQGRIVLEAMALGKPVVASAAGGILDMVSPDYTGWVFEVGDAEGLASRLLDAIANHDEAAAMGLRGREYVERHFTPAKHTARSLEIFRRVLSSRGGTRRAS